MKASDPARIFVISVNGSTRRERFVERAKGTPLRWQFFDALTTLDSRLTYIESEAATFNGRPLTPGEIGCYSSHFALWQQLLGEGADRYIILEDDVIVDWQRLERLAAMDLSSVGIAYLRLFFKRPCEFHLLQSHFVGRDMHLVEIQDIAFGTQGYVITRKAAETLVRYCRRAVRPIDIQLDRYWDHGVPNLSLFPFPLLEEASGSDIGIDRFGPQQWSLRRKARHGIDILQKLIWKTRRPRLSVGPNL